MKLFVKSKSGDKIFPVIMEQDQKMIDSICELSNLSVIDEDRQGNSYLAPPSPLEESPEMRTIKPLKDGFLCCERTLLTPDELIELGETLTMVDFATLGVLVINEYILSDDRDVKVSLNDLIAQILPNNVKFDEWSERILTAFDKKVLG